MQTVAALWFGFLAGLWMGISGTCWAFTKDPTALMCVAIPPGVLIVAFTITCFFNLLIPDTELQPKQNPSQPK